MAVQTAERVSFEDRSDSVIYARHLIAYEESKAHVTGHVLEVGCGEGYGVKMLAPLAEKYTALDKHIPDLFYNDETFRQIDFIQCTIPPFPTFENNMFDRVVTFQVIEHIKNDALFSKEIYRILKPGGKLILTTPNKRMSLTRNPWHIREYTTGSMRGVLETAFDKVEVKGIFGDEKVMNYYEENKSSVQKFTRFDVFNMQYWLPRFILKIPYDIANRMNRKKLLNSNEELVNDITWHNYFIDEVSDTCLDFYCIAEK